MERDRFDDPGGFLKRAVEEQIAAQVSAMRAMLESQYAERFARHEAKISALEGK